MYTVLLFIYVTFFIPFIIRPDDTFYEQKIVSCDCVSRVLD